MSKPVSIYEHRPVKSGCCPLCERPFAVGPFRVDLASGRCEGNAVVFFLKNRPAQVLDALNRVYPNGLSKAALHRELYGDQEDPPPVNLVESYVSQLRRVLTAAATGHTVCTRRPAGYALVAIA